MNMNDFLKIRIIKKYKTNGEKEIITMGINLNRITNFYLNDEMIIIYTNNKNSIDLVSEYRISKENPEKKEESYRTTISSKHYYCVEESEFIRLQELLK